MSDTELTGLALDRAVATCEGATDFRYDTVATYWVTLNGKDRALRSGWAQSYLPSTNWEHGGPIIERENIAVWPDDEEGGWFASADGGRRKDYKGPTPLIAAMRCYVASKINQL